MRLPLIMAIFFLAFTTSAQNRLLNKNISIAAKDVPIEKILEKITTDYAVNFSYGKDNLKLDAITSVDVTNVSLDKFLEQLLTPFGMTFTVIGNQVVLKKKEPDTPRPKKTKRQISGLVKDAATAEPLAFASVLLQGTAIGTITNADGEFVLLAEFDKGDSVKISYLGYVTAMISITDKDHHELTVQLVPTTTQLQSIVIEARSPESIVLEAIRRIPDNYRTRPYRQTFYLRDRTWADGRPIQATESIYESYRGDVALEGYRRQVKLLGARRSRDDKKYNEILKAFRSLNGFDIGVTAYFIFEGDLARFSSPETFMGKNNWKHYEFHQEDNTVYDGREVYVIAFDQKNVNKSLLKGRFYIDTETYAFIHISQTLSPKGLDHAGIFGPRIMEKIFGLGENVVIDWAQEKHYRNVGGKWFLDHMTLKPQLSLIKTKRMFNNNILSESNLVVTDIDTTNTLPFADEEVASARKLMFRRYGEYDYDFWKDQNVIKPDASFDEAFTRIETQNGTITSMPPNTNPSEGSPDDDNASADWSAAELDLTKDFPHFRIHYRATDCLVVDSVNQILEQHYARILNTYQVRRMPRVDIYIYPSVQAYHASINYPNAPAWMVGSATINKFSIVSPLNPGPAHSYATVMKGIVHEFMHCIHIHIVKNNMSKMKDNDARWLWEGLACYEAQQDFFDLPDFKTDSSKWQALKEYKILEDDQPEVIYDLGYTLMNFIRTTWGQKAVLKLIKTNGDLERSLGVTDERFYEMWMAYLDSMSK